MVPGVGVHGTEYAFENVTTDHCASTAAEDDD